MLNKEKVVPIFFSVNNGYAPYLAVAINSLKKCINKASFYYIRILNSNLSENNIRRLQRLSEENVMVECVDIAEHVKGLSTASLNHLTSEALFRILIPKLFAQYEKVLYLDCDIVVLKDVEELFDIDLEDKLLGVVKNPCNAGLRNYIEEHIKIPYQQYFNSGILLINAQKFREEKIAEKCLQVYADNKSKYLFVDQDALNVVCNEKVKYLEEKWNFEWHYKRVGLLEEYETSYYEAERNPYIIHYTSDKKPWGYPNMMMAEYFWGNARETAFYEEILYANIIKQIAQNNNEPEECFKTFIFPYSKVPRKSNIAIYAAGAVGKAFYQQMSLTKYCNVLLWVDKKHEELRAVGMQVDNPSKLELVPFDYLVIAVEAERQAQEIKKELELMKIDIDKIIWESPRV